MLHILNSLPLPSSFLKETHSGDTVIFIDNVVLAVKHNNIEIESSNIRSAIFGR